ncbi:MAG: hypothetical protein IKQ01_03340 [Bacteroidales bacterium]|jgi:hypothetical protein|nr:hypothetical protein [Bacteroidales bacterium]
MTRHQISNAIRKALEASQYSTLFRKQHGGCFYLCFEMNDGDVKVCPPEQGCGALLMFPDQVKEDTIIVSTDVIRLPQDMDEGSIAEKLIKINAVNKGIRYEVPFLYHASPGINRAVLVIKEVRSMTEDDVSINLPAGIEEVLKATAAFVEHF